MNEVKKDFEEIERLSQNLENQRLAHSREKFILDQRQRENDAREEGITEGKVEGKAEGIVEGKKVGKIEGKAEIVLNMLEKQIPKEIIAELTKVPIEKIEEIMKKTEQ